MAEDAHWEAAEGPIKTYSCSSLTVMVEHMEAASTQGTKPRLTVLPSTVTSQLLLRV